MTVPPTLRPPAAPAHTASPSTTATRVKICGVTTADQALAIVELGADAIGVNFVPASPRCVEATTGRSIVAAVGGRALVVAVVADMALEEIRALRDSTGATCVQLHGDEPPSDVAALLPHAYKAVRVATAADVEAAATMPGDYVLVDARHPVLLGGSGHSFDWSLVVDLATRRRLVLAGGLTPDTVARAVATVRPWCVDVASGVERSPRLKDLAKVEAFIRNARAA